MFTRYNFAAVTGMLCTLIMLSGCGQTDPPADLQERQNQKEPPTVELKIDSPQVYEKLKEDLFKEIAEFEAVLSDAKTQELMDRLQSELAAFSATEQAYLEARSKSAGGEQLAEIMEQRAVIFVGIKKTTKELLDRVDPKRNDVLSALTVMAMVSPDRMEADKQKIMDAMQKASKQLEPLRQASRVIVPVTTAVNQSIEARKQAGEQASPEMEAEELYRTLVRDLETKFDQKEQEEK